MRRQIVSSSWKSIVFLVIGLFCVMSQSAMAQGAGGSSGYAVVADGVIVSFTAPVWNGHAYEVQADMFGKWSKVSGTWSGRRGTYSGADDVDVSCGLAIDGVTGAYDDWALPDDGTEEWLAFSVRMDIPSGIHTITFNGGAVWHAGMTWSYSVTVTIP